MVAPVTKDNEGNFVITTPGIAKFAAGTTTYYGKWVRSDTVTLSFDTTGGSQIDPMSAEYGTQIADADRVMPTPTRLGYTFAGWFYDADLANEVETNDDGAWLLPTEYTDSQTYYAAWDADAAFIKFVTNGGTDIPQMEGVTDAR